MSRALTFLFLSLIGGPALAGQPPAQAIAHAVSSAHRVSASMGVHVLDLESGETVYARQADQPLIIASNLKLFVTAAAIDRLGPGYFFETELLARGRVSDSVLRGDLGVVGGGDPNISGRHYDGDSLAVFRAWAAELKRRGVQRVEGDVYLDHGLFAPPRIHPDWPRDQLSKWYEAPVEALSFNDNCVLVRVWPARRVGLPPRIEIVPDLPLFEIRNRARTVGSRRAHRVAIDRINGSNVITISGSVYRRAGLVESWVTVADPVEYFGAALRKAFEEEGIEVLGEVGGVPALPGEGWRRVALKRTDLITTAEVINKRSQNFFAESLLKLMGARLCGEGTWRAGRRVMAEFLGEVGIEPGSYQLADGSGMSRNNRFAARQITTLLSYMFLHPRGAEYLVTLPYSGEEGLKWENRLAEDPYQGNVFAKTGHLRGVSTLSGYAKARSGKVYAFSILMNSIASEWRAQREQDRIVKALVDNG